MIVPIVEGRGEVAAVPLLLRRILAELGRDEVGVARPVLAKRNLIVKPGELENRIAIAEKDRPGATSILVLVDADDDCARDLATGLRTRALAATPLPCAVVVAVREYEAWFLGAVASLRGHRGIHEESNPPADPEFPRDAKGAISAAMPIGRRYVEVADQPAFSQQIDLSLARAACPSFDKLWRDIDLLAAPS